MAKECELITSYWREEYDYMTYFRIWWLTREFTGVVLCIGYVIFSSVGTWTCWSKSGGGHRGNERAGAPLLQRQAERAGAAQPGEEKEGSRVTLLRCLKGLQKNWTGSFHRDMWWQDKGKWLQTERGEGRFGWDISKKSLTVRVIDTGTGCPEKMLMSHPWKCSRPGGMELGATWPGGRCPCPWHVVGIRWSSGSLPTPAILWFHGYVSWNGSWSSEVMCMVGRYTFCSCQNWAEQLGGVDNRTTKVPHE